MELTVLGVLEFNSIAIGIKAMDAMVKTASVKIIEAKTICPGKFLILIGGDVASVDASLSAGKKAGRGYIIDELFLPNLHKEVIPAISGSVDCKVWDALGVIESFSVIASIEAGDIAAKVADIHLTEIKLATGIGGKSYLKMIGSIDAVEAAMQAGVKRVKNKGLLCQEIIIPKPHPDIKPFFI